MTIPWTYNNFPIVNNITAEAKFIKGAYIMKATGIVRRIDDLGRVVIPKEIRRTMRIREGDHSLKTLTWMKSLIEVCERFEDT